jgi:hypothetical protein
VNYKVIGLICQLNIDYRLKGSMSAKLMDVFFQEEVLAENLYWK